jgi:putative ABC transport system substrate-binding protein
MSYGPNFPDLFRRSADYVDKILRGAKPGFLSSSRPIFRCHQSDHGKGIGLTIPESFLLRMDATSSRCSAALP